MVVNTLEQMDSPCVLEQLSYNFFILTSLKLVVLFIDFIIPENESLYTFLICLT